MPLRSALGRAIVLSSGFILVLPLWIRGNRADPLFLLPMLGWIALACLRRPGGWRAQLMGIGRTAAIAMACLCLAVWAASGSFAVMQIVIVGLVFGLLVAVHCAIARDGMRIRRLIMHAMLALLWIPVGMMIANASYGWPGDNQRPKVTLLSSMPLVWGVAGQDVAAILAGQSASTPIYDLLTSTADVQLADAIVADRLQSTDVLLLIQPRPLPPEGLVTLDDWVRRGGSILWLADPNLGLNADFHLGDPRNPEQSEANLALLNRWGLQWHQSAATGDVMRWRVRDNAIPLVLFAPGQFVARERNCRLRARGRIADCRVGAGRALILADADMVRAEYWLIAPEGPADRPIQWTSGNGYWIVRALRDLAGLPATGSLAQPIWLRPWVQS
jgi:hypothetical protein